MTNLASKPAYQSAYTFAATSTTPTTSPIRKRGESAPKAPRVIYTTEVWTSIQYIVGKCAKEVGWLGTVEFDGDDYWITEIFIPEQEVTGVTTEIEGDALADLAHWLMENDRDPGQLYYWGHSHVNMGVSPSSQDESQLAEYLDNCRVFIRGIYNKKGDTKVDVFDRDAGIVFQCVSDHPEHDLISHELKKKLDADLDKNVSERRYLPTIGTTPGYTGYSGRYPNYEGGYYTQQAREEAAKAKTSEPKPWKNDADLEIDMYEYMYGNSY